MSARDEAVEMIRRICPPHLSADEYGKILAAKFDAHRAEVLTEADLLPKADVFAWLLKRAHEYPTDPARQESVPDVIARLASKVQRGAVRPDNLCVRGGIVLTIPVHAAPDFFEPGRTYLHQHEWKFRCDAVTAHPVTGKRVAVGYSVFSHSDCQTSDLGDSAWADGEWTDVTGSGEGQ